MDVFSQNVERMGTDADEYGAGESRAAVAELSRRLRQIRVTPAQRAVARFILANPEKFVFMSGAEVAADVGVSQPSVTRLAQELGYRGYGEMATEVRELVRNGRADHSDPRSGNAYQQLMDTEIGLLKRVRDDLGDQTTLDVAATMIKDASEVVVLGLRISAPVAEHFAYRLRRLRDRVVLTTCGGSITRDELALASQQARSVLVAFAMSRYPAELAPALEFARARGMGVVLFIDTAAASICQPSDHLVIAPVSTGVTFGSLTAAYLLSAFLIDRVAYEATGASGRRLIDLESVAADSGYYLDDSPDANRT